jgi:MoxR-like ATPase
MSIDIYKGTGTQRPWTPVDIKQIPRQDDPADYTADANLAAAVNVALVLGKPLLVTGEPGTGKTELARHIALELGLPEPERFDTKSTSQAVELFYHFDSLARFHSANMDKVPKRALDFIVWGPLGRAILLTLPQDHPVFTVLGIEHPSAGMDQGLLPGPRRSVILIDEIDKAPLDFPNDLLDAIDQFRFGVHELERETSERLKQACGRAEISADRARRPVVVITSNSEKNLPAPFLRRCVYHHIAFPGVERLLAIVSRRVQMSKQQGGGNLTVLNDTALAQARSLKPEQVRPLLRSAVKLFENIRQTDLIKPPSTAELIDWVSYLLRAGAEATQELKDIPRLVNESLGVLAKSVDDMAVLKELVTAEIPAPRD